MAAALLLVGMLAVLFYMAFSQLADIGRVKSEYTESAAATASQLEREYLRFVLALDRAVLGKGPVDRDGLRLSFDLLLSRIDLLEHAQALQKVRGEPHFQAFQPQLAALVNDTDVLLAEEALRPGGLAALLVKWGAMGQDFNTITMEVNRHISRSHEELLGLMQAQSQQIVEELVAEALLFICLASLLVWQIRQQMHEKKALRRLTEELTEANARAEAASQGKSRFLANMSHELRTPLNGMLGMLGLMESTRLDVVQTDYIQTARNSARHLLELLNDVLDLSAMDASKMELRPDMLHLAGMLGDLESLVGLQARAKGVGLQVSIGPEVPRWVVADDTRLRQILLNLLSNAVKFSDDGMVMMTVSVPLGKEPEPGASFTLSVEVADQGIGMDAATLQRLFQRFARGDDSTVRRHGGSGLGLEISRNLARMMGGDITATSTLG